MVELFAIHAIAAVGSITLGTGLSYPFDTIKTLVQLGSSSGIVLTSSQVLKRVQSVRGTKGLYSGFGCLYLGRVAGLGSRFGVYELLTAFYKDGREGDYVTLSEAFLAGFACGAVECVLTSPFELLKLRAQARSASRHSGGFTAPAQGAYPWMMAVSGRPPSAADLTRVRDVVSLEGWGALWSGLRAGLVRDCVFGGVFFSCWEYLHRVMLFQNAARMDPPPSRLEDVPRPSPLYTSLAAGLSGAVAAAVSHCFDTARTRAQCLVLPKHVAMERKLLRWKRPGSTFERITGIHPADRNVLFRGFTPRVARTALSSFAFVASYLLAVDFLQ